MNIDWDNLADELSDTPRARLQLALDHADDMVSVLIVYEAKGPSHLESTYGYHAGITAGGGAASFLGLAEWARAEILDGMLNGETG